MGNLAEQLRARREQLINLQALSESGGPTIGAALAARRAQLEQIQGKETVAEVNGGFVYRDQSGALGFTSPEYSTTDQGVITGMLQGVSPAANWQRDIDQQRIAGNPVAARANEFVRGTPFIGSYADEAVGMVSPQAGQNMLRTSEAMQREKPGQTAALNVLGGVVGSVPAALVAGPAVAARAPASVAGRVVAGGLAGGAAGATEGAVWGFGEGRIGADRLRSAGRQAGIGAAGGLILGGTLPFAAEGVQALAQRWRGSDVSAISKEFNISKPAARMLKTAFENNDQGAVDRILRAGPDATLADAGRSGQALLDATAQTGGRPLNIVDTAVQSRAGDALGVVNDGLDTALGPVRGPRAAAREIASSTAPSRSAAYDAAFSTPINYADDTGRAIEDVFSRTPKGVLSRAINEANEQMLADGKRNLQILFDADTGKFAEMPNVQQLDEIKKALGNMGAEAVDNFGRPTAQGRRWNMLSGQLRDALKEATGGDSGTYARALSEGQGKISMDQGLQLGLDMLRGNKVSGEQFAEDLARLPVDARQMVKSGLRSHIDETLANVKIVASDPNMDAREAMAALKMLTTRSAEGKLRALLGKDAGALLAKLRRAQSGLEMRAAVARNSATAIRQGIQSEGRAMLDPGAVGTLARGRPVDATQRLTQQLLNTTPQADSGRASAMWAEIADVLSAKRGDRGAQKALKFIEDAMAGQPLTETQAKFIANTVTLSLPLSGSRAASPYLSGQ